MNRPGAGKQLRFVPVRRPEPPVRVERLAALRVAFVRRAGAGDEWGRGGAVVERWLESRRRGARGDWFRLGLVHDDPEVTEPVRRRYDQGVAVGPRVEGEGEIGVRMVGGGLYAVATHRGARRGLWRTARWLARALVPRRGLSVRRGPVVEVYLNSEESARPEELVTDVMVPIEPLRAAAGFYFRRMREIQAS